MVAIRKMELTPVFVDMMPGYKEMEEGKLYISKKQGFANHLCACGCGKQSPMDIKPHWKDGWDLIEESDGTVSFKPSIGNWNGEKPTYHAHYFITHNKIEWL